MTENFPTMGQPRKGFKREFEELDPEWEDIILDTAQKGKSMTWWCIKLGIHPDTFKRFARDNDRFNEVWEMAKLLQLSWWEDQGQRLVETGKGNSATYQLVMCNTFGYRGQNKIINQIGNGRPSYTGELDDTEEDGEKELSRDELLAELEKRGLPTTMFKKQYTADDEIVDAEFKEI